MAFNELEDEINNLRAINDPSISPPEGPNDLGLRPTLGGTLETVPLKQDYSLSEEEQKDDLRTVVDKLLKNEKGEGEGEVEEKKPPKRSLRDILKSLERKDQKTPASETAEIFKKLFKKER